MEENESKGLYCEKLPRRVTGKTCQSLAPEGNLCGKPADVEISMYGDPGVHEDAWVAVFLCKEHADLMDLKIWG